MYDVIFANSVLCHHPWDYTAKASDWYPFSLFDQTLQAVAEVLRPKGILSLVNTNYRLEDTSVEAVGEFHVCLTLHLLVC